MLLSLIAFVVLLAFGISLGELELSHVGLCLAVAVGALLVIVACGWPGVVFFSILAVMDAVLVVVIFKGDIRIG